MQSTVMKDVQIMQTKTMNVKKRYSAKLKLSDRLKKKLPNIEICKTITCNTDLHKS